MNQSNIDAIYNLLDSIKVTKDNKKLIEETRKNMENGQYAEALEKLKLLNSKRNKSPMDNKHLLFQLNKIWLVSTLK